MTTTICWAGCSGSPGPPVLVVGHVWVVDVSHGALRPEQTILIRGRRIENIAPAAAVRSLPGARLVDGSGKYLIPGLWDMHVHLEDQKPWLSVLVAHGVTGTRDMGGNLELLAEWRRAVAVRHLLGPRLVVAGPRLRGPPSPSDSGSWVIRTAAEGEHAVDSLVALGADFIKVWEGLSPAAFFGVARAARARRVAFAGHVSASVTAADASDSGQASIEHLEFIPDNCLEMFDSARVAGAQAWPPGCAAASLDSLFRRFERNHTRLVPTISSYRNYVSPGRFSAIFAGFREIVPLLRESGVEILAGTDLGNARILPGVSLHDELRLLVEAGFSPAEALRAATVNATRFLGLSDSLGTVEVGKIADLVLIDGNPFDDIRSTRLIIAVIRDGELVFGPLSDGGAP